MSLRDWMTNTEEASLKVQLADLRARLQKAEARVKELESLAFKLAEALEQYEPDFGGIMDEGLALRATDGREE